MDPDEIRRKRLEKLQGSVSNNIQVASKNTELQVQKQCEKPKPANIPPVAPAAVPAKKPMQSFEHLKADMQKYEQQTDQEWENSTLAAILQISLLETNDFNLYYLGNLSQEFRQEGLPLVVTSQHIERILYARITEENLNDPFLYLLRTWKRCQREIALLKKLSSCLSVENRARVLDELQSLIISYSGLALNPEMQEIFPANNAGSGCLGRMLVNCNDPESEIPRLFLDQFIARFQGDGLEQILRETMKTVLTEIRTKKAYDDFQRPFRALNYIISFKTFAHLITVLPDWNPTWADARVFEIQSILGPFFSRSSILPDSDTGFIEKYFSSGGVFDIPEEDERWIGNRNLSDVRAAQSLLRDSSSVVTVDRTQVSTDGFLYNLFKVCLVLCDPIMDPSYSKLHLIDSNYFFVNDRWDISDETKINADKEQCEKLWSDWKASNGSCPSNFVSEIFFATLGLGHFGFLSITRNYNNISKDIQEIKPHIIKLKKMQLSGAWNSNPLMQLTNDAYLKRLEKQLDDLIGQKLALESAIFDQNTLEHILRYYSLVIAWVLQVASDKSKQHNFSQAVQGYTDLDIFPMTTTPPMQFITLPELIIEDICEFYLFLAKHQAPMLEKHSRNEIVTLAIFVLSNSAHIKNPYLKSKLVEILFFFTLPLYISRSGEPIGKLDGVFMAHPLAKKLLIPCILQFYVDVEQTGMSSQFYDKFNIRYNISQILKSVWHDHYHMQALITASRNHDFFVKFVALLMNDTTYLLDEALTKLKEIGSLTTELAIALDPNSTQEEKQQRQEKEKTLMQLERQASSCMALGNETVHMLQVLTGNEHLIGPFMAQEVVERLAAMLDYNLVALAGPKCTELKVQNPEKYHFKPKQLLNELVLIFLHLAERNEFVQATAKDGRSFQPEVFERACGILQRTQLFSGDQVQKLLNFVSRVKQVIDAEKDMEQELGDVPDEYLDPLLYTLMEDPVTLPSSGVVIDLSTIKSHLLSDKHDPFNRQPLSIEDVIPNLKLKQEIEEWKKSKK